MLKAGQPVDRLLREIEVSHHQGQNTRPIHVLLVLQQDLRQVDCEQLAIRCGRSDISLRALFSQHSLLGQRANRVRTTSNNRKQRATRNERGTNGS